MAHVLLLTTAPAVGAVLPSLDLLGHEVELGAPETASLVKATGYDLVLVDATTDLAGSRALCQSASTVRLDVPVLLVLTEGGMAAVGPQWGADDVMLAGSGPAEVEARLRLASRHHADPEPGPMKIKVSGVVIDEDSYTAKVAGRALNLTFKEFELLKYLAGHPGRVFTREALLQEVWGYDYFGGTRTVDVHVRRLRAKLGSDHDQLIGTVRNVGYRFAASTPEENEAE
ncbi:MAG: winged helix-turn-helix transcriptional regulator [Galactobacter sp.]